MNTAKAAIVAVPKAWISTVAFCLAIVSFGAAAIVPDRWVIIPVILTGWFVITGIMAHGDAVRERLFRIEFGTQPSRAYQGDAGYDVYSPKDFEVGAGQVAEVPTGVRLDVPKGYFALIQERSSMARRCLFTVGNVIDGGYKGEVHILIANMGRGTERFQAGDRIAQILILRRYQDPREKHLPKREDNGFGSSGA